MSVLDDSLALQLMKELAVLVLYLNQLFDFFPDSG